MSYPGGPRKGWGGALAWTPRYGAGHGTGRGDIGGGGHGGETLGGRVSPRVRDVGGGGGGGECCGEPCVGVTRASARAPAACCARAGMAPPPPCARAGPPRFPALPPSPPPPRRCPVWREGVGGGVGKCAAPLRGVPGRARAPPGPAPAPQRTGPGGARSCGGNGRRCGTGTGLWRGTAAGCCCCYYRGCCRCYRGCCRRRCSPPPPRRRRFQPGPRLPGAQGRRDPRRLLRLLGSAAPANRAAGAVPVSVGGGGVEGGGERVPRGGGTGPSGGGVRGEAVRRRSPPWG